MTAAEAPTRSFSQTPTIRARMLDPDSAVGVEPDGNEVLRSVKGPVTGAPTRTAHPRWSLSVPRNQLLLALHEPPPRLLGNSQLPDIELPETVPV